MKKYNLIVVFRDHAFDVLFCKRTKNPFKECYNFPGGKIKEGEDGYEAAYRELLEETGISKENITLEKYMEMNLIKDDILLEIYSGFLSDADLKLKEEINPLIWLNSDLILNKKSLKSFAGNGNIPYILEYIKTQ